MYGTYVKPVYLCIDGVKQAIKSKSKWCRIPAINSYHLAKAAGPSMSVESAQAKCKVGIRNSKSPRRHGHRTKSQMT